MATNTHADPMKHKTGKPRLGPLNVAQLQDMLEKSSKPKDKAKIRRALERRMKTQVPPSACTSEQVVVE